MHTSGILERKHLWKGTFFSVRCAMACFWLISLDSVLEAVMTVMAVSFSKMLPSAPERTSMILSSTSASCRAFSAPCSICMAWKHQVALVCAALHGNSADPERSKQAQRLLQQICLD